jgi:hypothetical protein
MEEETGELAKGNLKDTSSKVKKALGKTRWKFGEFA